MIIEENGLDPDSLRIGTSPESPPAKKRGSSNDNLPKYPMLSLTPRDQGIQKKGM